MWPHNFKLKKLKKYNGKENPANWITLYEIAIGNCQVPIRR
jgi:hypothetical protein